MAHRSRNTLNGVGGGGGGGGHLHLFLAKNGFLATCSLYGNPKVIAPVVTTKYFYYMEIQIVKS